MRVKTDFIILHHIFMRRDKKIYSFFPLASAVLMILALLWLTVSLPFVFESNNIKKRGCSIALCESMRLSTRLLPFSLATLVRAAIFFKV